MKDIIPAFDWYSVMVMPWTESFDSYGWIMLMGFLVGLTCSLVGVFLVLRQISLVGDAISHSLLPGIALAFLISGARDSQTMLLGAIGAGVLTTVLTELIYKKSRLKLDAALGTVFTTFFAIGVIIISIFADSVDLDAECVLYGEIAFIALTEYFEFMGILIAPMPVVRLGVVCLVIIGLITVFYKELMITSFDVGLAKSLGINVNVFHYGLMIALSVVIVYSFESVGAILVIALLIFPAATAQLLTDRMSVIFGLCPVFSGLYSVLGLHLAIGLDCSIAGAMSVIAGLIFGLVWLGSPSRGLIAGFMKRYSKISLGAQPF